MSFERALPIADAVLYEGWALYPYRASSVKNRHRWTFGTLHPESYADENGGVEPSRVECQCLLEAPPGATIEVRARFLHLLARTVEELGASPREVAWIDVGGRRLTAWEEATPRDVDTAPLRIADLAARPHRQRFELNASSAEEIVRDPASEIAAAVRRRQPAIEGELEVRAIRLEGDVHRVVVSVTNRTPLAPKTGAEEARLCSLGSAHLILRVCEGAFVSLIDPPAALAALAEGCRNQGAWPVLVGDPGARDLVLCSPIILSDYPAVAPESPGDLFDGTEIDEILTLRILTLTEPERREATALDDRVRALLDRTDRLAPAELARMHGALRARGAADPPAIARRTVRAGDRDVGPGDRVRLRPRGRSDIFDLALEGEAATIASIEQDYEDRLFVTVTVDGDPGRDLGAAGKIGHRFFFRPDELEPLPLDGELR